MIGKITVAGDITKISVVKEIHAIMITGVCIVVVGVMDFSIAGKRKNKGGSSGHYHEKGSPHKSPRRSSQGSSKEKHTGKISTNWVVVKSFEFIYLVFDYLQTRGAAESQREILYYENFDLSNIVTPVNANVF